MGKAEPELPAKPFPSEATGPRIPSLDGLRAISILMVLFAHLLGTKYFLPSKVWRWPGDLGNLGVRVFFVISGFLITSLLLHEVKKTGTISLKEFYLRRTFRIFPAFYAYLAVMMIAWAAGLITLRAADAIHAATYTVNYVHNPSWYVGHIWSLSVEEQFYLLWPAAWLLLPRGEGKRRGAAIVATIVILVAPLARIGTWVFLPEERALIGKPFPTIADSIAFGCLLACVRGQLEEKPLYMRFLGSPFFFVVPVLVVLLNRLSIHVRPFYVAGETMLNLMIAVIVDRSVRFPGGPMGRLLNSRLLSYIGVLSYSIYLWQQPFVHRESDAWHSSFPMNVVLAGVAAALSYYLVERPMLRLRGRLFDKKKARA